MAFSSHPGSFCIFKTRSRGVCRLLLQLSVLCRVGHNGRHGLSVCHLSLINQPHQILQVPGLHVDLLVGIQVLMGRLKVPRQEDVDGLVAEGHRGIEA